MSTLPRQAQPDTAFLIKRLSPELIDMIIGHNSYPNVLSHSPRPLALGRNAFTMALSLVCHDLAYAATRSIWRIAIIRSDERMEYVRGVIEASGGSNGRVGSAITAIHAVFASPTRIQEYVTLASNCANLRRFEAPLVSFASVATANFHRLTTLCIRGDRNGHGFEAINLVGLTRLKHLTICTTLRTENCPKPTFSLVGLVWEGAKDPDAIRWVLQNSTELKILMLYAMHLDFVRECLMKHGGSLLSLRLNLQGTIPKELHSELFESLWAQCPKIIEVLLDIGPDPESIGQLSSSLKRLALKPYAQSSLLKENTLVDYIEANQDLHLTLWGEHIKNVIDTVALPKSQHKGKNQRVVVKRYAKWKQNVRLDFIAQIAWPFVSHTPLFRAITCQAEREPFQ